MSRFNGRWMVDVVLARIPQKYAARIIMGVIPDHTDFGRPFNGQACRQEMVRELLHVMRPAAVVETGTYGARTTAFLRALTGVPVVTVESSPRFYEVARVHLAGEAGVEARLGDSRAELDRLAADPSFPKDNVFFYLDAHWGEHLPLREELERIGRHFKDWVVLIDDFRVPDDDGYGFDDYGPGRSITLEYVETSDLPPHGTFFPSAPSSSETPPRRGSVVLCSESRVADVRGVSGLRSY